MNRDGLISLADTLKRISPSFKISARGWCYQLEVEGFITKAEFDKAENAINKCRKEGYLPIDFIAEEAARSFSGVEFPTKEHPSLILKDNLLSVLDAHLYYTPEWWNGEQYYIQMVVEKIDLKTLFSPICRLYHIPIATSKGWGSINQRAEYARRFKDAEDRGLKGVLLYCGDFDPDGLRISDFLLKNLYDIRGIIWGDGETGYNPSKLIIDRFGINYDFIIDNKLTWIDNLITGSKRDLASPSHRNYYMDYLQHYLANYGIRKCEANAIIPYPDIAEVLVKESIIKYLGKDVLNRFRSKEDAVKSRFDVIKEKLGINEAVNNIIEKIDNLC